MEFLVGEPVRFECVGTAGGTKAISIFTPDGVARVLGSNERLVLETVVIDHHNLASGDTISLKDGTRVIWGGTKK